MNEFINDIEFEKKILLLTVSNPKKVIERARQYLGDDIKIYISPIKNKKYRIYNPNGKAIDFGDLRYKDFTYTNDEIKKNNYLKRSANIRGNWKDDKYSANNLARVLLWDAPF